MPWIGNKFRFIWLPIICGFLPQKSSQNWKRHLADVRRVRTGKNWLFLEPTNRIPRYRRPQLQSLAEQARNGILRSEPKQQLKWFCCPFLSRQDVFWKEKTTFRSQLKHFSIQSLVFFMNRTYCLWLWRADDQSSLFPFNFFFQ